MSQLIRFAETFKDDEDEPSIIEKLRVALKLEIISNHDMKQLESEIERTLKMFYLQMRVKGNLKPYKDDYFI